MTRRRCVAPDSVMRRSRRQREPSATVAASTGPRRSAAVVKPMSRGQITSMENGHVRSRDDLAAPEDSLGDVANRQRPEIFGPSAKGLPDMRA